MNSFKSIAKNEKKKTVRKYFIGHDLQANLVMRKVICRSSFVTHMFNIRLCLVLCKSRFNVRNEMMLFSPTAGTLVLCVCSSRHWHLFGPLNASLRNEHRSQTETETKAIPRITKWVPVCGHKKNDSSSFASVFQAGYVAENSYLYFEDELLFLFMRTCLSWTSFSPEGSTRLQSLQQAIHDTSFVVLCKINKYMSEQKVSKALRTIIKSHFRDLYINTPQFTSFTSLTKDESVGVCFIFSLPALNLLKQMWPEAGTYMSDRQGASQAET